MELSQLSEVLESAGRKALALLTVVGGTALALLGRRGGSAGEVFGGRGGDRRGVTEFSPRSYQTVLELPVGPAQAKPPGRTPF